MQLGLLAIAVNGAALVNEIVDEATDADLEYPHVDSRRVLFVVLAIDLAVFLFLSGSVELLLFRYKVVLNCRS